MGADPMCTAMALYVAFSEPAAPSIHVPEPKMPLHCASELPSNYGLQFCIYIPPGQHEIYKYSKACGITMVSLFHEKDADFLISGFLMYSRLALTNLATRKVKTMHLLRKILCKV